MGQTNSQLKEESKIAAVSIPKKESLENLCQMPLDILLSILSHLSATDLFVLSCVSEKWAILANNDRLWYQLCQKDFGGFNKKRLNVTGLPTWKEVYLNLDDAALLFNIDPNKGLDRMKTLHAIAEEKKDVPRIFRNCPLLDRKLVGKYLSSRDDMLKEWINLYQYNSKLISQDLRYFLASVCIPSNTRGRDRFIAAFAKRHCECTNNKLFSKDAAQILSTALIILAVDLETPQIANKMSKREFIKNVKGIAGHDLEKVPEEYLIGIYDDVYENKLFIKI